MFLTYKYKHFTGTMKKLNKKNIISTKMCFYYKINC